MLEVFYTNQAKKDLKRIDKTDVKRIIEKINQYAENPDNLKNKVEKLQGREGFRLRVGDYRVIFNKDGVVLMIILEVGRRGNIYKKSEA